MGKRDRTTWCQQDCNRLGAGIDRRHSMLALAARHVSLSLSLPWSCSRSRSSREWVPRICSSRAAGVVACPRRRPREPVDVSARVGPGRGDAPRSRPLRFWRRPPPQCVAGSVGYCHSRFGRRHVPWAPQSGTACDQSPPLHLVSGGTRSYVCRRRCTTVRAFACTRDIGRGRAGARTSVSLPYEDPAKSPIR